MRKMILALTALTAIAAPVAMTAAPAEAAGNPSCMTRTEYTKIHKSQAPARVAQIVGAKGRVTMSGFGYVTREFKICGSQFGFADVDFHNQRVDSKFWFKV